MLGLPRPRPLHAEECTWNSSTALFSAPPADGGGTPLTLHFNVCALHYVPRLPVASLPARLPSLTSRACSSGIGLVFSSDPDTLGMRT